MNEGADHFYALIYEHFWDTMLPALERVSKFYHARGVHVLGTFGPNGLLESHLLLTLSLKFPKQNGRSTRGDRRRNEEVSVTRSKNHAGRRAKTSLHKTCLHSTIAPLPISAAAQEWQSGTAAPRGAVTSFGYSREEVDTVLLDYRDPTGRVLRTKTQMFRRCCTNRGVFSVCVAFLFALALVQKHWQPST